MTNKFTFYPEGVCSMMIEIELEGEIIKDVVFTGGCNGNLSGISRLIKGMNAEEVIGKLEGTRCGFNDTSCPDQLSKALRLALNEARA
jgi:uncharacterized protein (TIGR03905 family)